MVAYRFDKALNDRNLLIANHGKLELHLGCIVGIDNRTATLIYIILTTAQVLQVLICLPLFCQPSFGDRYHKQIVIRQPEGCLASMVTNERNQALVSPES